MAQGKEEEIRNIALVGHSGSGKTMLAEALLLKGKEISRLGRVGEGSTVSDFEADEKENQKSVFLSALHTSWKGRDLNILDAPGSADFVGQVYSGLAAAEMALLCVNASSGIEVGTRKAWELIQKQGCACMCVITRMDAENAQYEEVVAAIQNVFGAACLPVLIPVGSTSDFQGVINLLQPGNVPDSLQDTVEEQRSILMESVVAGDDALLERYLEGESISPEELEQVFTQGLLNRSIIPIVCCSAERDIGVSELLDLLAQFTPAPSLARKQVVTSQGVQDYTVDTSGPLLAQVFKVTSDEFVGKISFIRVYSGTLKAGDSVVIANSGRSVKIPKLFRPQGKEQKEVAEAGAGAIVSTTKVEELHCGDTLSTTKEQAPLSVPHFPLPMVARAIEPQSRGDEAKISESLRRLAETDPTFQLEMNPQTKELVISGIGEQHIGLMLNRLRRRGVQVSTKLPKIAYRETISGKADIRYRHKKQTGGAGQFAECAIRIEPNGRGAGYEFVDKIFGGVISQPFRQSVDKGIQDKMGEGVIAGYPVVDIKVELYDGKEHPVDSKDIAFQIAGREALKEAIQKASPVLLEPIVKIEVVAPSKYMGDITGDISSRRGRVSGIDALGDLQMVRAEVPLAEVQEYSAYLQSVTGGEGSYNLEFLRYEVLPAHLTQGVVSSSKHEES